MKESKWLVAGALVLGACSMAIAQDNPVAGFGTAGGSNARTYVYGAPYVFADGSNLDVAWKHDIGTDYLSRRGARGNVVFDENQDAYFTGGFNAAVANSGVIKVSGATGNLIWASPLKDTVFNQLTPIVGADAVYSARHDPLNPTIYALNKTTGAVIWESDPLPQPVRLSFVLYNGVIYGLTLRDGGGSNYAFAIDASDGTILYTPVAIPTDGDIDSMNLAFKPNAFGADEHGFYWNVDPVAGNQPLSHVYAVQISAAAASPSWNFSPCRIASSHVIYNAVQDSVYALHWGDYGSAVESLDPATGAAKWRARSTEMGSQFNGGFYPSHTLKPNSSGFLFAGFSGDVWSVTDPGDLAGAFVPAAQIDWYVNGNDLYGESQTMAFTVTGAGAGSGVFISGTSANAGASIRRRLYAQDVATGKRLWEWQNPADVLPFNGGFNFRCLSVGPDGGIYYMDANEGVHGTLYKLIPVGPLQHGACCFNDGSCIPDLAQFECEVNQGGSWIGLGTVCGDCPQPGACCLPDKSCEVIIEPSCTARGGTFVGAGVACEDIFCAGACCLPGPPACCIETGEADCTGQGGTFRGGGTKCATVDPPCAGLDPDQVDTDWSMFNGDAGLRNRSPFATTPVDIGPFRAPELAWGPLSVDFSDAGIFVFDDAGDLYYKAWQGDIIKIDHVAGTVAWRTQIGGCENTPPIIGDHDRLYGLGLIGCAGSLTATALDLSGNILWQTPLPGQETDDRGQHKVALLDGKLYVLGKVNEPTNQPGWAWMYQVDSTCGNLDWIVEVDLKGLNSPEGYTLAVVPDAFGLGLHGMYFNGDLRDGAQFELVALQVDPTGAQTQMAWTANAPFTWRSHVIASPPPPDGSGLLYVPTYSDFGNSLHIFSPDGTFQAHVPRPDGDANHGHHDVYALGFGNDQVHAIGSNGSVYTYTDSCLEGTQVASKRMYFPSGREYGLHGMLVQNRAGDQVLLTGTINTSAGGDRDTRVVLCNLTTAQADSLSAFDAEWTVPDIDLDGYPEWISMGPFAGPDGKIYLAWGVGFDRYFVALQPAATPDPGACCLPTGGCAEAQTLEDCLSAGGVFAGASVLCVNAACENAGSCCLPDSSCVEVAFFQCTKLNGTFNGIGSLCANVTCTGSCCLPDGSCVEPSTLCDCAALGGTFNGIGISCTGTACPKGACCLPDNCIETSPTSCVAQGGVPGPDGSTCLDDPPICQPNDLCANATPIAGPLPTVATGDTTFASMTDPLSADCGGNTANTADVWYTLVGDGCKISLSMCAQPVFWDAQLAVYTGTCGALTCVTSDDDACGGGGPSRLTFQSTAGVTYTIRVFGWDYQLHQQGPFEITVSNLGACCVGETCTPDTTEADCTLVLGGVWHGCTPCDPNPCLPTGACCVGNVCTDGVTETDCTTQGGVYKGGGSVCQPVLTACYGDADCSAAVDFDDINYFVAALAGGETGWTNYYMSKHGGTPPPCTFWNCDANAGGECAVPQAPEVDFDDINPFVAKLVTPPACP